jgi:hypothetical protein
MALQRARTAEEYADWVQQAKFEVEDLRECLLYDAEDLGERGRFPDFLEPLAEAIDRVYQDMRNGSYAFGREDLPFLELAERHSDEVPFLVLLKQINETHRKGLDVEET